MSLRLPAKLEYTALRALLRVLLGKKRRTRLLSAKAIDLDEFMTAHLLHRDLGFSRDLDRKRLLSSMHGLRIVVPKDQTALVNEVQEVYLKPDNGDIVLDVGAHYGFYTLLASELVGPEGQVLAFEPCYENYKNLLTNLQANKITNVQALRLALSDFEGTTELKMGRHSGAHSIVLDEGPLSESVKVTRLDAVVNDLNLGRVDLVKVDAEGSEWQILRGALSTIRRFHPKLTVAAYHLDNEAKIISDWLSKEAPFYRIHYHPMGFVQAVTK